MSYWFTVVHTGGGSLFMRLFIILFLSCVDILMTQFVLLNKPCLEKSSVFMTKCSVKKVGFWNHQCLQSSKMHFYSCIVLTALLQSNE